MITPNKITIARICLIPVFLTFFFLDTYLPYARLISAIIFIVASLTDFLDGYLARKLNKVTVLGTFLDTIADKMLVTGGLIVIIYAGAGVFSLAVVIMLLLNMFRDHLISGLRTMAAAKNIIIKADMLGKIKATFQMYSLIFLISSYDFDKLIGFDLFLYIGFGLLTISTVFSMLSGIQYMVRNGSVFKDCEVKSEVKSEE